MAPKITTREAKRRRVAASAVALTQCEDMLIEILMRLPPKHLLRCKEVSTRWYTIISDPLFVLNYAKRNPNPLQGLILNDLHPDHPIFFYISPTGCKNYRLSRQISFLNLPQVKVHDFCNGLLCYSLPPNDCVSRCTSYFVCNPTFPQSREICVFQSSEVEQLLAINFAFDPLKSPFFSLIFVGELFKSSERYSPRRISIVTYSSKTRSWRCSRSFSVPYYVSFRNGVHWNGAIYWLHEEANFLACFDCEIDHLQMLQIPQLDVDYPMFMDYFGESGGNLYMVGTWRPSRTRFCIFEMSRDRSGWFPKYQGDFDSLATAFPKMVKNPMRYELSVATVLEGEEGEVSMVLCVPGKVVLYNVRDRTTEVLRGLPSGVFFNPSVSHYLNLKAFKWFETLACIYSECVLLVIFFSVYLNS